MANKKESITGYNFWVFQILIWVSIFSAFTPGDMVFIRDVKDIDILQGNFATYFGGFISTSLLHLFYKNKVLQNTIKFTSIVILNLIVSAFIWYWLDNFITWLLLGRGYTRFLGAATMYLRYLIIGAGWIAIYFVFKSLIELAREKQKNVELSSYAKTAQFTLLRYQLNPHFLFNSLNSIRALIYKSPADSDKMISKLSDFMRYSLTNKNEKETPLEDEIEVIRNYLDIEKIRFGDKLSLEIKVDPIANEYPIPPFLIIPLIENAVKYGMKTSNMPLEILFSAEVIGNDLIVLVKNTGKWYENTVKNVNDQTGTGTGLENIRARLENIYGSNYSFEITKTDKHVSVQIIICKEIYYDK